MTRIIKDTVLIKKKKKKDIVPPRKQKGPIKSSMISCIFIIYSYLSYDQNCEHKTHICQPFPLLTI